jgi:cleavage and polyadenylation specificity factor subunit 3
MLDCGIHPGHSGLASLPFLDEVDLDTVDAALITHFHLDHCAAVPYLIGRTNFKGRLLMTHATKAIFHTLLADFVRVSAGAAGGEGLYGEEDLEAAMARAEVIDFDETRDVGNGIRVTAHRAGHVLGAAMFTVDIEGARVLYTGDYSRVADRHLPAADTPAPRPDIREFDVLS